MRLLVSGASGLIGKNFIRQALRQGYEVHALVRDPSAFLMLPPENVFRWQHNEKPPLAAFKGVSAIVHLAGENIADARWTKERKERIVQSRLVGTKNLIESLRQLPQNERPKSLISGSAIGYYGYNRNQILDESSSQGRDFLADLCGEWEKEALKAESLGLRVVMARTGIVISREGGVLTKMPPVKISDGANWMSWIHVQDMIQILLLAIKNSAISGSINCTAPNPVQNKDFVQMLAEFKKVPALGSAPKFFLNLVFGEVSQVMTSSLNVIPQKLIQAGFKFLYPDLNSALKEELAEHHLLDKSFFRDQFVPLKPEEVFPFFSKAENLEALTPPWLNFKIVSKSTEDIDMGSTIDYKLKIHGVPVKWKTRISDWKKNESFIDEQIKGPYSKWHHLHTFDPVPGGCLLRDEVTYRVPASILGKLMLGEWISRDVNEIFKYRQKRINELNQYGQLK